MLASLRLRVACAPWGRLPAPLWFLVASPALRWAFGPGSGPWFAWPLGRASFWAAVADARRDPFFPCSWPVAFAWVAWHWRFVRSLYR